MAAWRYEIYLLVLENISILEEKFRISPRPCNILYLRYKTFNKPANEAVKKFAWQTQDKTNRVYLLSYINLSKTLA